MQKLSASNTFVFPLIFNNHKWKTVARSEKSICVILLPAAARLTQLPSRSPLSGLIVPMKKVPLEESPILNARVDVIGEIH